MRLLMSSGVCGISLGETRVNVHKTLGSPQFWQEGFESLQSPGWQYNDPETRDYLQVVFDPAGVVASLSLSISIQSVAERPVFLSRCLQLLSEAGIQVSKRRRNHAHYLEFGHAFATFLSVYFNNEGDQLTLMNPF